MHTTCTHSRYFMHTAPHILYHTYTLYILTAHHTQTGILNKNNRVYFSTHVRITQSTLGYQGLKVCTPKNIKNNSGKTITASIIQHYNTQQGTNYDDDTD